MKLVDRVGDETPHGKEALATVWRIARFFFQGQAQARHSNADADAGAEIESVCVSHSELNETAPTDLRRRESVRADAVGT